MPCCWRAMFTLKRRCCHAQHGQRKISWQGAVEESVRLCSSKSTQNWHTWEERMLVAQSSQPGSRAERPSPTKLKGVKPACQASNWFCTWRLSHLRLQNSWCSHQALCSLLSYLISAPTKRDFPLPLLQLSPHQHTMWWYPATRASPVSGWELVAHTSMSDKLCICSLPSGSPSFELSNLGDPQRAWFSRSRSWKHHEGQALRQDSLEWVFQLPPPDWASTNSFHSSSSDTLLLVMIFQLLQTCSVYVSDEISANQGTNAVMGGPASHSYSRMPAQAAGRVLNQCSVNYLTIKRVLILLLMSPEGFSENFTPSLLFEHILSPPPTPLLSPVFLLLFFLTLHKCLSSL